MINASQEYTSKNPIRATISNTALTIHAASEAAIVYAGVAKQIGILASTALDVMIIEQKAELAKMKLELESQAKTSLEDL